MGDDTIEKTEKTVVQTSSVKTPVRVQKSGGRKQADRIPWQRLFLSLTGLAIIAGMWRWATYHLYSLPEPTLVAFASITNNAFYVIAAIVVFMVTGKLVYDWKNQTATTLIDQASHLTENRHEERREERKEEKTENQNINIEMNIKEAGINAPALKPFGQTAIGDEHGGEHDDYPG